MCRWLAYSGNPIYLEELIFLPEHSLIDQSLSARSGETTNGDGFGIGWTGERAAPGVFKDVRPAWNDPNLRDLSHQIRSGLFLAHVRAATPGLGIQRSNCHPFRSGAWLFCHNGSIRGFRGLRRRLLAEVSDDLFEDIDGTTDSELLFCLALTFGLSSDPRGALLETTRVVEAIGRDAGVEAPLTMTLGLIDGESLHAVRYSSERDSRTLYVSDDVEMLEDMHPETRAFGPRARMVVSEPLTDLPAGWIPVEESTFVTVRDGEVELLSFEP